MREPRPTRLCAPRRERRTAPYDTYGIAADGTDEHVVVRRSAFIGIGLTGPDERAVGFEIAGCARAAWTARPPAAGSDATHGYV